MRPPRPHVASAATLVLLTLAGCAPAEPQPEPASTWPSAWGPSPTRVTATASAASAPTANATTAGVRTSASTETFYLSKTMPRQVGQKLIVITDVSEAGAAPLATVVVDAETARMAVGDQHTFTGVSTLQILGVTRSATGEPQFICQLARS